MLKHISFWDLDDTLWENDYKVWIIDKNNPSKPVLILDPVEFALIKKGHYRKDHVVLDYNGQKYWISNDIAEKLKRRQRTENIERFGISLMPMVDRELLNKSKLNILTRNIEHIKSEKFVDIGLLTARSNQRNNSDLLNKLRVELKNMGIDIKKIFFVGKSVYIGQNYVSKMVILLEHLVGFKIRGGKFVALKQDWYPRVDFYDDDPQNINYANDIQKFFDEILRKTDDEIHSIIMERLDSTKLLLKNYLVTTNEINKFVESRVELKKPVRFPIRERKHIQSFDNFISD